jgi:prepilin-type processing-associated H-X9-DG protein
VPARAPMGGWVHADRTSRCHRLWKDWSLQEFAHHGWWICPSAPAKAPPGSGFSLGTVDAAWSMSGSPYAPDAVSSYAWNGSFLYLANPIEGTNIDYRAFLREDLVTQSTWTPLVADSIGPYLLPTDGDMPATNLYTGDAGPNGPFGSMKAVAIPRHGNRPRPVPRNWPITSPLPGAVNMGFFDGHAQAVKLDALWQLYWCVGYWPPPKRPGLK